MKNKMVKKQRKGIFSSRGFESARPTHDSLLQMNKGDGARVNRSPTLSECEHVNKKRFVLSCRGQVAIFIIIAVLIVAGVGVYFLLSSRDVASLSQEMQVVYDYYLSCIEEHVGQGVALLGEQGGYIYADELDFVPGSQYMPFSSQLDFLGQPVPYWMYVSGNNLLREQVPTKAGMEGELERYVRERASNCDFSDFSLQGYDVLVGNNLEEIEVSVDIKNLEVSVDVENDLNIYFEEQAVFVGSHELNVDSKLGKFYELALDTYNHEKESMFLEKYALDVMRLYAPVSGVELSCVPKVFVEDEIKQDLAAGLEANIAMLKLDGSYYDLADKDNNYFVEDIGPRVDENVNFIYSSTWGTNIEIHGDKVVEPVGLQEGLGILGFCYVDYNLVYDIHFPVLIQFWDSEEMFQFPVAVVIRKNQAREALPGIEGVSIESEVCKYNNQDVNVYTYDSSLNPVEARVSFKCLNSVCDIGETSFEGGDAVLRAGMPQCVNGFIRAKADGFAETKYQISTNEEASAEIILSKLYNMKLDLGEVDKALVRFDAVDYKKAVVYPDVKSVELIEGSYNVSVYVYDDSSLTIPAVARRECVDVPREGVGGLLGQEEEKCFDINIPETVVEMAVVGGGKTTSYFSESQLASASELNINVPLFGKPASLDDLQGNYIRAEDEEVFLDFE